MDRDLIKELVAQVANATKQENSGLIRDIQDRLNELKLSIVQIDERHRHNTDKIVNIEQHLAQLNSKTAKHSDMLKDTAIILERCTENMKCLPEVQAELKSLSTWRSWVTGISITVLALGSIISGLIVYIYQTEKAVGKTIELGVDKALSKYEITYEEN